MLLKSASFISAVATLFVSSASLTFAQQNSPTPNIGPAEAQFREFAQCPPYWEIMRQCLPTNLSTADKEQLKRSFDQLASIGETQLEWLGDRAGMASDAQKRVSSLIATQLKSSPSAQCNNAPSLLSKYRDRCAALVKLISAEFDKEQQKKKDEEKAAAKSAPDAELDCAGTLEDDDRSQKKDATAHVMVMAGQVIVTIKPYGAVMGSVTKTDPNFLRFKADSSTFTVEKVKPVAGLIDRVNATVSIFLRDAARDKGFAFWLNCKVRKPQF